MIGNGILGRNRPFLVARPVTADTVSLLSTFLGLLLLWGRPAPRVAESVTICHTWSTLPVLSDLWEWRSFVGVGRRAYHGHKARKARQKKLKERKVKQHPLSRILVLVSHFS